MSLTPGTRLGVYKVTAQIGAGGMGDVYRATDSNLKRAVAIKVLPASVAGDADRLARFQREAEVLAALNHPNIVTVYDVGHSDGTSFIAMELVDGRTVRELQADRPLPTKTLLAIAAQIADGLAKAHAVEHRCSDARRQVLCVHVFSNAVAPVCGPRPEVRRR